MSDSGLGWCRIKRQGHAFWFLIRFGISFKSTGGGHMTASHAATRLFLIFVTVGTILALAYSTAGASAIEPRGDTGSVLSLDATGNTQLSRDADCSTKIVLAIYFKSRYCKTGTLIVAATSNFKTEANLELLGYGPMKWHNKSQTWMIRVRDLEVNPEVMTVDGAECATQAEIITVPYGCDAKFQPDMADDP
jgi:hypothetical protein